MLDRLALLGQRRRLHQPGARVHDLLPLLLEALARLQLLLGLVLADALYVVFLGDAGQLAVGDLLS